MFAKIGEAIKLNRRAKTTVECVVDNNVMGIIPTPAVNSDYLFQFMRTVNFAEKSRSTTVPSLRKSDVEEETILLPPLAEQVRIADKLDTLLARVDAGRERLERVPRLIKQFRRAVLSAAMSGDLTRDWRGGGDPQWDETTIGSLATDIRYGTAQKCDYDASGTPVLRIPNVNGGQINTDDLKFGKFEEKELKKLVLRAGDILMIRSNGSADLVGQPALVGEEHEGYLFAGYLIRLRLRDEASPEFVWHRLSAPDVRGAIETSARSSSGVHNINAEEIREITFDLPPLP
ncbi:4'-phosphopantetheinyl transferase, partial [Methylobacterium radiotolerans]